MNVVFASLPDSLDMEAVAPGKDGILSCARQGLIFVDNSTQLL
jgi:3-hydroxyisobutyrate dehydrogenase-like beta-hydroxyacid dehydrogenase